jgi:hypothetical protein
MRWMRLSLAAGVAAAAIAAAVVLGAGSAGSATGATADATALAPKGAGAFVVVDTDLASAQWKSAQALLAKIPGGQKSLDSALSQLGGAKAGVNFARDVAPALGKELVVVVPSGAKDPVLLVRPDDPKKFAALLAKEKKRPATGHVAGWTAVATTRHGLQAYEGALAKGTLANDAAYATAMSGVPTGGLVRAYLNGSGLPAALAGLSSSSAGLTGGVSVPGAGSAIEQLGTIGFALTFGASQVRLDGSAADAKGAQSRSFTPTLLGHVPADALVAVSFDGAGSGQKAIDQALGQSGAQVKTLEKQLGVTFADLASALDGEGVAYVRAGSPIPEITLVVQPKDARRAKATFAAVAKRLNTSGGSPVQGLRVTTTAVHGLVFVSTAKRAAADFEAGGGKLTATDRFKQTAAQIGFAGKTAGLGYVDVHALGPLLKTALGALGGSGSTTTGLEGLSAFGVAAFNSVPDGSRTRFAAVVTVG